MYKEYLTISEVNGPLLTIEQVTDARYMEIVEIELQDGSRKRGQVLMTTSNQALVQVFEGTEGIGIGQTRVKFLGESWNYRYLLTSWDESSMVLVFLSITDPRFFLMPA